MREKLLELREEKYQNFLAKLIPNIPKSEIIGIRAPILKQFFKENKAHIDENFLKNLPHDFHEENLVHAFLINEEKNFEKCLEMAENFLPFMNNWAVTDTFNPKILQKNLEKFRPKMEFYLQNGEDFEKRAMIFFAMKNFLGKNFDEKMAEKIAKIRSEEYYVNMMIAWFFAEWLAQNYEKIIPFLEGKNFEKFVQNKIISKARESRKIDEKTKEYLKTLRK